jgi:hypothetical protein
MHIYEQGLDRRAANSRAMACTSGSLMFMPMGLPG